MPTHAAGVERIDFSGPDTYRAYGTLPVWGEWLRHHTIDPDEVHARGWIERDPEARQIRYRSLVILEKRPDSAIRYERDGDDLRLVDRTVQLEAEPLPFPAREPLELSGDPDQALAALAAAIAESGRLPGKTLDVHADPDLELQLLDLTGDPSGAIEAARQAQAAIEGLRRDFVHFRTDDGGMRYVRIADVVDLHEWESEL